MFSHSATAQYGTCGPFFSLPPLKEESHICCLFFRQQGVECLFLSPGWRDVHLICHFVTWPTNGLRISPFPIICWANGGLTVGGTAKPSQSNWVSMGRGQWPAGGDSPVSLTTTEADPESRVLGFLAIQVYVPSVAADMLLMLR